MRTESNCNNKVLPSTSIGFHTQPLRLSYADEALDKLRELEEQHPEFADGRAPYHAYKTYWLEYGIRTKKQVKNKHNKLKGNKSYLLCDQCFWTKEIRPYSGPRHKLDCPQCNARDPVEAWYLR